MFPYAWALPTESAVKLFIPPSWSSCWLFSYILCHNLKQDAHAKADLCTLWEANCARLPGRGRASSTPSHLPCLLQELGAVDTTGATKSPPWEHFTPGPCKGAPGHTCPPHLHGIIMQGHPLHICPWLLLIHACRAMTG